MKAHHSFFKKSLGQNFLVDPHYGQRIVDVVFGRIEPSHFLLEIGPGDGKITEKVLHHFPKFACLELDKRFVVNLKNQFPELNVIYGDATQPPLHANPKNLAVIGNLPYNVSVRIINSLITMGVEKMVFMVQKEVAERLCAVPGQKAYNSESVFVQYHAKAELLFDIPPGAFQPKPKVVSSLVYLEKLKEPLVSVPSEKEFMRFAKACFSQKRKMVRNNVKNLYPDVNVEEKLEAMGLKITSRAEELTIPQLAELQSVLEN